MFLKPDAVVAMGVVVDSLQVGLADTVAGVEAG